MRIEKISETQVKFILTHDDLAERNIQLNELAYGSDKTHQLFQEMMRQAMTECEFQSDNAPLMVEAMPLGSDSVLVVVTKITDVTEIEKKLDLLPFARKSSHFKSHGLIDPTPADEPNADSISLFSFDNLDDTVNACVQLRDRFSGLNRLYKCHGRYFLLLQNETEDIRTTADMEAILHEYGQKHVSNVISKHYLVEHGEIIILNDAVEKLAAYLS